MTTSEKTPLCSSVLTATLPTAPQPALILMTEPNRPQPRLDADLGGGMAVTIGRLRDCPVMHAKFVALGHNTVRGAAGAAPSMVRLTAHLADNAPARPRLSWRSASQPSHL